MLEGNNLTFYYKYKKQKHYIFEGYNIGFERGKIYAVTGRSGTGKSTLLSLLGGLKIPQSGTVLYDGVNINQIGRQVFLGRHVGIVFQAYNLIDYMSAVQNVIVSKEIAGCKKGADAYGTLESLGISREKAERNINSLSGGEQQRVAIACAIAKNADIILADEPTGNLDDKTAMDIFLLLEKLAHEQNKYVIMATHDKTLAALCDESIVLL